MTSAPALTWGEFQQRQVQLASQGRRLLYAFGIGLGFLASVRPDGGPRVHPISPLLTDAGLYGLIVPGPKLLDLRRDGRYALHSETNPPPRHDDAFYVTGLVRWPQDAQLRRCLDEQMLSERKLSKPWPGFEEQTLVEFLIQRVLLTLTVAEGDFPSGHTRWSMQQP